jgi:predicted permease
MGFEQLVLGLKMKLRALFGREASDRELDEELRYHVTMKTEENLARGMKAAEARRQALMEAGGIEQAKEKCRDTRGVRWIQELAQDLRFGLRILRKNPGFTTVAVLSLALGIGANTAIFTLIDAVLLKSLPVEDPQELVSLNSENLKGTGFSGSANGHGSSAVSFPRSTDGNSLTAFPYPAYAQMRDRNQVFSSLFAFKDEARLSVLVNGNAELLYGDMVTPNYFSSLGISPILGRDFSAADDTPTAEPVAIISYGYWQRRFGGDPSVLGKQIVINGVPMTISGVAPAQFFGLQEGNAVDVYMDVALQPRIDRQITDGGPSAFVDTNLWWIQVMGRLKPGVTAEQARANLDVIYRPVVMQGLPAEANGHAVVPPTLEVVDGSHGLNGLRGQFSQPLTILTIVVGAVLLIACVNVANLLLVRSAARRREIAVRLSLGASRARLIRQLLLESVLLASFGGVFGLVLAYWGCTLLVAIMQRGAQRLLLDVRPDTVVLAFTAAACGFTGILFGLAPAFRATRVDLTPALKQSAATSGTSADKMRITRLLVVGQVGLSLVLLFGAGLFVRTLVNLESQNVGFARNNLLLFGIAPVQEGYKGERYANLCRDIQNRLAQLPGVESATSSLHLLLAGGTRTLSINIPGYSGASQSVPVMPVGPDYLKTMGIRLLQGRDLTAQDDENAPKVALIDRAMAAKYWSGQNPLGQHFTMQKMDMEVVGVVENTKYPNLRDEAPPIVYHPYVQAIDSMPQMHFEIRTRGDAEALIPSVRALVASVDNRLPLFDVKTQTQQIDELLSQERLFAKLVGFFAVLALLLVCVGLYGVMAYAVALRTSEIGIRMALGAQPGNILAMVLREMLALVGIGVALGVAASCATAKLVAHQVAGLLYGLNITDAVSIFFAVVLIVAVALSAGFIPARRASKVDPMVALRNE